MSKSKKQLIKQGDNFLSAKLYGCNTLIKDYDNFIKVQYHDTDIVVNNIIGKYFVLNNDNYYTKTTKERINSEISKTNCYIFQKNYKWYIYNNNNKLTYDYVNGIKISYKGIINKKHLIKSNKDNIKQLLKK